MKSSIPSSALLRAHRSGSYPFRHSICWCQFIFRDFCIWARPGIFWKPLMWWTRDDFTIWFYRLFFKPQLWTSPSLSRMPKQTWYPWWKWASEGSQWMMVIQVLTFCVPNVSVAARGTRSKTRFARPSYPESLKTRLTGSLNNLCFRVYTFSALGLRQVRYKW